MQTLQLTYTENIATKTLALIFVNTEVKGDGKTYKDIHGNAIVCTKEDYDDAEERAEIARQTFANDNMLAFD